MKAVVMGGGKGTRLSPMTNPLNKHTLPVGDKPMIYHVLQTLARGGVDQVLILLNWKHPGIMVEQVGSGTLFGLDVIFKYLSEKDEYDPGRDGPGGQLYAAEGWMDDDNFVLILGDSFYNCDLAFEGKPAPHMWTMFLNGFDDPSKYSQVAATDDRVTKLVEHPKKQFSDLIQTGTWLLPSDVFDLSRRLQKETEGELRVSTIIRALVEAGRMTHTTIPSGSFIDLGTPEALLKASYLVLSRE